MLRIDEIVDLALEKGGSDIHIVKGIPVKCRIDGKMKTLCEGALSEFDCEEVAKQLAGDLYKKIEVIGQLDMAKSFSCGVRTRINIFRQQQAVSIVIRLLRTSIPCIEDLLLPPAVAKFPEFRSGIVLVTGETGSGKSTTLAAVLDCINHQREGHIITLEDPIEYVYTPDKCVINQREIGQDTESYNTGLRAILREDPDVILIGEMRDLDTIEAALTAAETGHLVFATLHTNSAADSIDRIISVFPEGKQRQIRLQLSTTLRAVLSQQLIPKIGGGRVAACEVMMVTGAIKNLIREGKTPQIDSFISMGAADGSITMDRAIEDLLYSGIIGLDEAKSYARDKEVFNKKRI